MNLQSSRLTSTHTSLAAARTSCSLSLNVALLTDIQPIQELPNILVPYSARLLDIRCRLRHVLDRVTGEFDLILDTL